ncbi:hypothetical protein QJQ45_026089, partial [Haematococcus lacustris]
MPQELSVKGCRAQWVVAAAVGSGLSTGTAAQQYSAICVVAKDENMYVREWLTYHRCLGVDKVYLYDHSSTLPLRQGIEDLIASGYVQYIPFTGSHVRYTHGFSSDLQRFQTTIQGQVYKDCLAQFSGRHTFMGFIDVDEFVAFHEPGLTDINSLLRRYEAYGGLSLYWVLLGSSGHLQPPAAGVVASYRQCLPRRHKANTQFKTFVNTAFRSENAGGLAMIGQPHHLVSSCRSPTMYSPHRASFATSVATAYLVDENMRRIAKGRNKNSTHGVAAVYHYATKSRADFEAKRRRGGGAGVTRPSKYLRTLDAQCTAMCLAVMQTWNEACAARGLPYMPIALDPVGAGSSALPVAGSRVPEDPDSDIEDRDEALQPDLTEAERNKKASREARAARDRDNTYHGRKCELAHLIDHLPQELWDAFLDDAVQPRVEACSERAVLASLLFGFLVRGLFTIHVADPLGLHDQPVYTDIPVSQAAIPDLSCKTLFLQLATVAHEERSAAGTVVSVWQRSLTAGQYYRDSGITRQSQATKAWLTQVKPQLTALSRVSSKPSSLASYRQFADTVLATYDTMWAEVSKPRWANAKFRLYCGKKRVVASFWAKLIKQAKQRWPDRILALAYGAAGFSGSGSIGCRGEPVSQMLKEALRQFPAGRVVMVDEFRTSRVSSAYSHPSEALPGQPPESFRWLRPVYSEAKRSQVRGLMCSTSNNIRFYDRDVSAALNIRRCAVGPGPRPTELCYWEGRPAMPKPGRLGQEWVYVRIKTCNNCDAQTVSHVDDRLGSAGPGAMSGDAFDRKVRPIYDALDNRAHKSALKLANAALERYKDNDLLLALKAIALERQGRAPEAAQLCDRLLGQPRVDEEAWHPLKIVLKDLQRPHDITRMYEAALSQAPGDPTIMQALFTCYARERQYLKQQQLAMRLSKTAPGVQLFQWWTILAIVLQVRQALLPPPLGLPPSAPASLPPASLLQLAVSMAGRASGKEGRLDSFECLLLWLDLLLAQGKQEEALALVQGPMAQALQGCQPEELQALQGCQPEELQALQARGQGKGAGNPDDWLALQAWLDCLLPGTGEGGQGAVGRCSSLLWFTGGVAALSRAMQPAAAAAAAADKAGGGNAVREGDRAGKAATVEAGYGSGSVDSSRVAPAPGHSLCLESDHQAATWGSQAGQATVGEGAWQQAEQFVAQLGEAVGQLKRPGGPGLVAGAPGQSRLTMRGPHLAK